MERLDKTRTNIYLIIYSTESSREISHLKIITSKIKSIYTEVLLDLSVSWMTQLHKNS